MRILNVVGQPEPCEPFKPTLQCGREITDSGQMSAQAFSRGYSALRAPPRRLIIGPLIRVVVLISRIGLSLRPNSIGIFLLPEWTSQFLVNLLKFTT